MDQVSNNSEQDDDTVLVILENDFYQRLDKKSADKLFSDYNHIVVLDYLENETTLNIGLPVLPAGTFAESEGTVINNEGRAQRFYQVHVPENEIKSSWKWLQEIIAGRSFRKIASFGRNCRGVGKYLS